MCSAISVQNWKRFCYTWQRQTLILFLLILRNGNETFIFFQLKIRNGAQIFFGSVLCLKPIIWIVFSVNNATGAESRPLCPTSIVITNSIQNQFALFGCNNRYTFCAIKSAFRSNILVLLFLFLTFWFF